MSLGTPTLKRAAAEALKSYPNSVGKAYEFSLQMINEYQESWLIPFLHSSSWHTTPSIEEGFSFGLICNMIEKGFIYLCFIEMPDWAQPNECLAENTEVLSTSNIFSVHLQNSPQGSDGYIQLTDDLTFYKLFLTDDLIPANPSRIVVKKGTPFPIEIGTNSVLKTWEYFANYITLATFPYNCPLITETPMLALFYINK